MRPGWRGDSFRHSLAAKGVRTNHSYYAKRSASERQLMNLGVNPAEASLDVRPPYADARQDRYREDFGEPDPMDAPRSPEDPFERRMRDAALTSMEERNVRSARRYEEALRQAQSGADISAAIEMIRNPNDARWADELTTQGLKKGVRVPVPAKIEALKAALNARALQLAQSGVPIDKELASVVAPSVLQRANTIQKYRELAERREFESPLRKQMREELTPAVAAAVVAAPGESIVQGGQAFFGKDENATIEDFDAASARLKRSAFVKDNAAIGWEEQASNGVFGEIEGTRFRSTWDFASGGQGVNPVMNKGQSTKADLVSDRVNSLYGEKQRYSEVDLSPFEQGMNFFNKGDREGLIKSKLELEKQEAVLKNRNKFIDQMMADMNSKENYADAFASGDSSNFFLGGSKGAEKLNEQAKKLHEVKLEVAQSYSKAFTRRRLLQQALIRLDSQIPPEVDVPREMPRTVSKETGFWRDVATNNPVVDGARSNPVVDATVNSRMINRGQDGSQG